MWDRGLCSVVIMILTARKYMERKNYVRRGFCFLFCYNLSLLFGRGQIYHEGRRKRVGPCDTAGGKAVL